MLYSLSYKDIAYVTTIAKYGNVTYAAQELFMTQPALSLYLSNLEKKIGGRLFERVGRRFVPTKIGAYIVKNGEQILEIQRHMQIDISDMLNLEVGHLAIGIPYVRGISFLPPVLAAFRKKMPEIRVTVMEADAKILEERLISGELDIIFENEVANDPRLECYEIRSDDIVLYAASDFPGVKQAIQKPHFAYPWVELSNYAELPFILNYPNQKTYQITQKIFEHYDMAPSIAIQVQNQLTAIHLASVGYGLYLAPSYFLENINILPRPVMLSVGDDTPFSMRFIAVYRKYAKESPIIQALLNIVKELY